MFFFLFCEPVICIRVIVFPSLTFVAMAEIFYQELAKYYAIKLNKIPLKEAEIAEIITTISNAKIDRYVLCTLVIRPTSYSQNGLRK